jgi:branched-chain amino acid transport system ATP-binding protein
VVGGPPSPHAKAEDLLLAEQNAAFAVRAADYVHVMSKGVIVYSSEPAALWNNDTIKTQFLGVPRTGA